MTQIFRLTTSTAILAALAACGSSTTPTTRNFAETAGTAVKALDDGKTLTAQEGGSSAANLNYSNGETSQATASFALKKNAAGELTFTVNGVEQAFATADRFVETDGSVYGYDISDPGNDRFVGLFSHTGTLDETLDPANTSNMQIWGYQTNQITGGPRNVRGFAVVGTETTAAALATLPSATYSGRARLDSFPTTGFVNNETSRTRTRGDVNMAANFGAGTISGQITNITRQAPGGTQLGVAGSVSMDPTTINGNGFAGTLTPNATLLTSTGISGASGTYGGTFYGPAGQQVGGTMTLSGTEGATGFVSTGFFEGNRN
ncbi:MAG: transferrin-binding protein-like solute binding protein [Gemmobacter sp.]